jgi:dTDP-4-amino-4,6-dideoxygalactose transaminase
MATGSLGRCLPDDCNIDLTDVERKLGPNTKAVVVVHWGGYPVDIDRLKEMKRRYEETYGKPLHIIEDCAHCWETKYKGDLDRQAAATIVASVFKPSSS